MHIEVRHPFIQDKLTQLRDVNTPDMVFRVLAEELTMLLAYEALKEVELTPVSIETPLAPMEGYRVKSDIVLVPVLRAGVGMLHGVCELIPKARVGFVGLYRDPETKQPVEYYSKLPKPTTDSMALVIDPMLATGGSINATIALLKRHGYDSIVVLSILAAPEGIEAVEMEHADVRIYVGGIDERLDDHKYIVPGLGDAGDRLFGTR